MLAHARGLAALCAPSINSYKRLVVGRALSGATWAPAYIAYGDNNRTCTVRVPYGRLELRLPDGSCNPYLATIGILAAGMDGIQKKLDPGKPNNTNLYEWSHEELVKAGIGVLPQNLKEALDALDQDTVLTSRSAKTRRGIRAPEAHGMGRVFAPRVDLGGGAVLEFFEGVEPRRHGERREQHLGN